MDNGNNKDKQEKFNGSFFKSFAEKVVREKKHLTDEEVDEYKRREADRKRYERKLERERLEKIRLKASLDPQNFYKKPTYNNAQYNRTFPKAGYLNKELNASVLQNQPRPKLNQFHVHRLEMPHSHKLLILFLLSKLQTGQVYSGTRNFLGLQLAMSKRNIKAILAALYKKGLVKNTSSLKEKITLELNLKRLEQLYNAQYNKKRFDQS